MLENDSLELVGIMDFIRIFIDFGFEIGCMIFGTISTAFAAITSFEGGTGVSVSQIRPFSENPYSIDLSW